MLAIKLLLVTSIPMAISGCNWSGPENNTAPIANSGNAAAATGGPINRMADAPTAAVGEIQGTFRRFERGDHLYAMFDLPPGREAESTALVRDVELAAFLNAHQGAPLYLVIQTRNERLDPPGEAIDVTSLVRARSATQTSQRWWQSLSREQQAAARTRIETLPAEGGG